MTTNTNRLDPFFVIRTWDWVSKETYEFTLFFRNLLKKLTKPDIRSMIEYLCAFERLSDDDD